MSSSGRPDTRLVDESSAEPSLAEEKAPQPVDPFATWSQKEIAALKSIGLDDYYHGLMTNTIAIMNEWIHLHETGWYRSQNNKLNVLVEVTTNKLREQEIHHGLKRYLETANKLKKPKQGQVERRLRPNSHLFFEKFVNVYRAFWSNCAYTSIYNSLLAISRIPAEHLRNGQDKIHVYALLKLKNQELPRLHISVDETKQLMLDIDKVIVGILSRAETEKRFFISEAEAYASLDLAHKILPKYHKLADLRREFEASPLHARYVHVRPAILIQFAQLIDYIYKVFDDAATEKKSLFRTYTEIDKEKAAAALQMLTEKRQELAITMVFHEKLALSFGYEDFIEALQNTIENKAVRLLPSAAFFAFEERQTFVLGEFDANDLDAPKPIPAEKQRQWRREYINQYAPEALRQIAPIPLYEVEAWLHEQANIKKQAENTIQTAWYATETVRMVSTENREKHNLFLISTLPDAAALKQEKYQDAYLFIKSPAGMFHVVAGTAIQLEIKLPSVFQDLIRVIKIKDESKPCQDLIDKNRLEFFWRLITLNESHLHLEITRITLPTVVAKSLAERSLGAATTAYNDQLVGRSFFSTKTEAIDELYDFFIARAEERTPFLKINTAISVRTLDFMLRQVDHGIDVTGLYSPKTMKLHQGPEGPVRNFSALIDALTILGEACDRELTLATTAMQKSTNSAHIIAFQNYIDSIAKTRYEFRKKAETILGYWTEQVKDIYPLPFRTITDFNRLLKDGLIALKNQPMLDYFNQRVYGAIVLTEQDERLARQTKPK
jgi:hypothetical protein